MLGSQLLDVGMQFSGRDFGLGAIDLFGEVRFRQAVLTGDSWQQHRGTEVVFMLEGQACWELADSRLAQVSGGQGIAFPGGLPHRIVNGIYPPSRSFWILFAPLDAAARWEGALSERELAEFYRVSQFAECPVAVPGELTRRLRELGLVLKDKRLLIGDTLRMADVKARLYSAVVEFWTLCSSGMALSCRSEIVRRSERLIQAKLTETLHVEDVANMLGYSRSRLHSVFRKEVGISPANYRQRLRIKQCCERLTESDAPITDIAGHAGFCSTQYFARVFRQYLGTTPTEYRRMVRLRA